MPPAVLNRQQAAQRLATCRDQILALGVVRLALFGSVLRADGGIYEFEPLAR